MALLAWPAGLCPQAMTWSLYGPKNRFATLQGKVQEKPNAAPKWRVSMTFRGTQRELSALEVLIDRLKTGDTVAVYNFRRMTIPGVTGTVRINGTFPVGKTFNVDGFTGTIKAGDFFQVGGELKRVTADRAGIGALNFVPSTRQVYADNTVLTYTNPNCAFTLADDETGTLSATPGWDSIGLDLIEFI
jgi:hypothetical protein